MDELRSVRGYYYLGFFSECSKEAKAVVCSTDSSAVKEGAVCFSYRAQGAQNPAETAKSIPANAPLGLQAVKRWCEYQAGIDKEVCLAAFHEWLNDDLTAKDPQVVTMAAFTFLAEKDYKNALKLVVADKENLEHLALSLLVYLFLDRSDLAQQALKLMNELDDDDALTQLAAVWVNLTGNNTEERAQRLTDAQANLLELTEKFGSSIILSNLSAVLELENHNFTAGFSHLKSARDQAIQQNARPSMETLKNSIVCLQQIQKSKEITGKIQSEMRQFYPNNSADEKIKEIEKLLNKSAEKYKWKV